MSYVGVVAGSALEQQIGLAKASLRRTKRSMPELLPEYHELKQAEQAVREAKERLAKAKRAWKALGT